MASRLSESTARVYFSVCLSPAWPRSEATVLMLAPLLSRLTENECRAQCQVICFSISAQAVQWRIVDSERYSAEIIKSTFQITYSRISENEYKSYLV